MKLKARTVDPARSEAMSSLLKLSHELGSGELHMAILGEGNASARLGPGLFLIKVSGKNLGTLKEEDVVECDAHLLVAMLDKRTATDEEVESTLLASRRGEGSGRPSVEAMFHAFCLSLPDVRYVGHTHGVSANRILCSPRAREFAEKRIFPDEVVCCGPASVFVPYTDPGFHLAREIRTRTEAFIKRYDQIPRVIALENHGIITIGRSPESVLGAMLMAEKSASVWIGAASLGGPNFLPTREIRRIAGRMDEHHRQRTLKL
jgi:rhamnose utilization protein RhaD (predicted bifunctional aldolase and dehydrogenase)